MKDVDRNPNPMTALPTPVDGDHGDTLALSATVENRLVQQITALGKMMLALEEQNRQMQKLLEARLTINTVQARALHRQISRRAVALCEENGIPYVTFGRRFRDAIQRGARHEFSVSEIGDLPAHQYVAAWEYVKDWESYRLARELRDKNAGGVAHA